MKRKPIVGMSLKIYVNQMEKAKTMAEILKAKMTDSKEMDVFLIPSMGTIYPVAKTLEDTTIGVGAQNIAPIANGAMTGEFSIESAKDLNLKYIELGHAERKRLFHEDYDMIHEKVKLTLAYGLIPILCIGETEKGEGREIELSLQIQKIFRNLPKNELKKIVLAYEPEWAIGQKEPAKATYVHETLGMVRLILEENYGKGVRENVRIIYGGSANKENAKELVNSDHVDGLFIGRFGHDLDNFMEIVETVYRVKNKEE